MNGNNIFIILSTALFLAIDYYIFHNVSEMQKDEYPCNCAKTSHLKNISKIIIIMSALQLINLIISFTLTISKQVLMIIKVFSIVSLIIIGAELYYIYNMLSYLNNLNTVNCTCVDKNFTNVMYYYAWTKLVTFILMIILSILAFGLTTMQKRGN